MSRCQNGVHIKINFTDQVLNAWKKPTTTMRAHSQGHRAKKMGTKTQDEQKNIKCHDLINGVGSLVRSIIGDHFNVKASYFESFLGRPLLLFFPLKSN